MKRTVELYGRLREAGLGDRIELELSDAATASEVLTVLKASLKDKAGLLDGAVLATHDAVLSGEDRLPASARLAALPPVCGG